MNLRLLLFASLLTLFVLAWVPFGRRNRLARESHRKKTLAALAARGINIEESPSCRRNEP